jgi:hypothetical protein
MIEFTYMECGCTGNVLEKSYRQYTGAIVDENWITAIWAHLERCEATVKVTGLWKPTHGRVNDSAIIEIITASGLFKPSEILAINRCRLYLQVFSHQTLQTTAARMTNIMEGMVTSNYGAICTGQ